MVAAFLPDPLVLAYVAGFGLAAVACFAGARRAGRLEDADTARGLAGLLVLSGIWAGAHVGYLLVPRVPVATAFHVAGLVAGFATVGAWLYFCSAYTGRTLHRDPRIRGLAVAAFLGIVLLKVTNPLHELYFTAELAALPFTHVAMQYGALHWIATGVAYALAAVGYFMLFELFVRTGYDTRPLSALVGVTALPVLVNILADTTALLVDIGYEPLGVAVFAVGTLYVFADRFEMVRLAGDVDSPVIYLDDEGAIRDYNHTAGELFPALAGGQGDRLSAVLPAVTDRLEGDDAILPVGDGDPRYFRLGTNRFSFGGTVVVFTDVTDAEGHRRALEHQNERLDRFASVVSHDLRNPLNVAKGRIDVARTERDDEHLQAAAAAIERMEALIEDVLTLARQGESIGEIEHVTLSAVLERCREAVDLGESTLTLESDLPFEADPDRVQQLLENLVRNATDHGDGPVAIRVGATAEDDGFYVEDDGPGIPAEDREEVFETGFSTAEDGTGFGLAIVTEIVEAHGWAIAVAESEAGGARFEITGVERRRAASVN